MRREKRGEGCSKVAKQALSVETHGVEIHASQAQEKQDKNAEQHLGTSCVDTFNQKRNRVRKTQAQKKTQ
jgi:hypothetical protein